MGFRITYSTARGKACFANQRVIAGAVEMYNMDEKEAIRELRPIDVTDSAAALVKKQYLKSVVTPPDINCSYHNYGDLSANGIVFCSQHGTLPEFRQALLKAAGIEIKNDKSFATTALVALTIFVILNIVVIILLKLLPGKSAASGEKTE
jgi:hypothetical protein